MLHVSRKPAGNSLPSWKEQLKSEKGGAFSGSCASFSGQRIKKENGDHLKLAFLLFDAHSQNWSETLTLFLHPSRKMFAIMHIEAF